MDRCRPTRSIHHQGDDHGYDAYKDSAPGAAVSRRPPDQELGGSGSSGRRKALKEAGQWTDEQEAHNKELLKRQQVLAAAWADYSKPSRRRTTRRFSRLDEGARRGAAKANMPNGFE
jgi:hypothetical protein